MLSASAAPVQIPLSLGYVALVDAVDAEWVLRHKWFAHRSNEGKVYARRAEMRNRVRRVIYLHRAIAKPPPWLEVDHRNGNGLDCRRENLRVVTHAQNNQNRQVAWSNTGVLGVCFDAKRGRYVAQVQFNGKNVFLKRFLTLEEAAEAVRAARAAYLPYAEPAA